MFHDWDSFYLLIGSASGALIGLLFVVVTLTAGSDRSNASRGQRIYMTPTLFHFAVVMVASGIALTPGLPAWGSGLLIGVCALTGLVYVGWIAILLHSHKVPDPPHWSDFWAYGSVPAVIYLVFTGVAGAVATGAPAAPFGVALVLLFLLLLAIRNAWDLVTWIAPRVDPPPAPNPPF